MFAAVAEELHKVSPASSLLRYRLGAVSRVKNPALPSSIDLYLPSDLLRLSLPSALQPAFLQLKSVAETFILTHNQFRRSDQREDLITLMTEKMARLRKTLPSDSFVKIVSSLVEFLRIQMLSYTNITVLNALLLEDALMRRSNDYLVHAIIGQAANMKTISKVIRRHMMEEGDADQRLSLLMADILQVWGDAFAATAYHYPHIADTYRTLRYKHEAHFDNRTELHQRGEGWELAPISLPPLTKEQQEELLFFNAGMKRGPPQPSSPTMTEIKGRLSFEKEKKKTQKERRSSRDWDNIPEAVGEEEDEENIEANHALVGLKPAKPARAASYRKPVEDASPLLSLDPHTEETPPLLDLLTNEEDHHNTAEPPFAELLTLKAYEDTPPPSSSEALTCEASESNPSSPASVTARVSIGTNTMPLPSSDVPTLQIPSPLPIPTTEDDDIAARRARFLSFQKLPAVVIAGREEANGKPTTGHEDDDVDGGTALDVLRKGAAEGSVPPPPSPDLQAAGLRFTTTPTPLPAARTEPEAHEDQTHPSLHSSGGASRQSGEQNSGTKGKSDTRRKSYDPSSDKDVEVRYYGNQRVLVRKSNGGAPNKYF